MAKRRIEMSAGAAAAAIAAPALKTASKGGRKVTVASKLPMDLILQLCQSKDIRVTGQYGSTVESVHIKTGPTVTIRGTAYPVQAPKGFPKPPQMIEESGFALTNNVDADFFEQWLKQNADTEMVRNGLIHAAADLASLEDETSDFASARTGLEPLDPDKDSRNPQPINTSVAKVSTDEDRSAQRNG